MKKLLRWLLPLALATVMMHSAFAQDLQITGYDPGAAAAASATDTSKMQQLAVQYAPELIQESSDPIGGNANGSVVVVEFYDYNCPHCVKMTPIIDSLVASNPNIRVVYKPLAFRGAMSEYGSLAAFAANNQSKFHSMNEAIMASNMDFDADKVRAYAAAAGLDMTKWSADMQSPATKDKLSSNMNLARDLRILGTPTFYVMRSSFSKKSSSQAVMVFPGEVDLATLQQAVTQMSK